MKTLNHFNLNLFCDNMESIDKGSSVKNQYLTAIFVSMTTFCCGTSLGWLSPALPTLKGNNSPLGKPLSEDEVSLIASMFCIGAIAGAPIFGTIVDRCGRKAAALACAVPFMTCWLVKIWAQSTEAIVIARVIAGIGSSGALLVAPLYCCEIGSSYCRGKLTAIAILAINAGTLFAYVIGALVRYDIFIWILLTVPVIFLLIFSWMPETPIFLIKQGKDKEAAKAIAWLRHVSLESAVVQDTLIGIRHEHLLAHQNRVKDASLKEILLSPVTLKAFGLCMVLVTIQGSIGMFAIISFASEIFKGAGGSLSPNVSSIIISALQLLGSYTSTICIERFGRKNLLMASAAMVSLGMTSLGIYLFMKEKSYDITCYGWVPLITLSLAITAFSVGVGPIPIVISSEVFVVQARGILTTALLLWAWVTSFVVSQFYNKLISCIGLYGAFWLPAIIAFLGVIFTFFFVPETKGKELDEILKQFLGKKNRQDNETTIAFI